MNTVFRVQLWISLLFLASGLLSAPADPVFLCEVEDVRFARVVHHASINTQYVLVSGDLDGSGRSSFVVGGIEDVAVIRSLPGGRFAPPVVLATHDQTHDYVADITLSDLDHDGDLDIATFISRSQITDDPVFTYFNLGEGSFSAGQRDIPAAVLAQVIAQGDLDGDGDNDLLTGGYNGDFVILENTGTGILRRSRAWRAGTEVWDLLVADFRGRSLEAVVASHATREVLVGSPLQAVAPRALAVNGPPRRLAASDLDLDGDLDLLVAHGNGVSFFVNGVGEFEPARIITDHAGGNVDVAAGDCNGDGHPDVGVLHSDRTISLRLGEKALRFQEPILIAPEFSGVEGSLVTPGPRAIDMADYDGDGRSDLLLSYSGGSVVTLYLDLLEGPRDCNGNGVPDACDTAVRLTAGVPERILQRSIAPGALAHADLDADGSADLLVVDESTDSIILLANNGSGAFKEVQALFAGRSPVAVEAADFDRDGSLDILSVNSESNNVSIFLNRGDGLLSAPIDVSLPAGYPVAAAVADLDGDGRSDLVTASRFSESVAVSFGEESVGFRVVQLSVGDGPNGVGVGDIDGDGRLDLVASSRNGPFVRIFRNIGERRFSAQVPPRLGFNRASLGLMDLDADGRPEVVSGVELSNVSLLPNRGDGRFLPARRHAVGFEPLKVISSDLRGDGLPDLVVIARGRISVLLDDGGLDYLPEVSIQVAAPPKSGTAADVDGDGVVDLIWSDASSLWLLRGAPPQTTSSDCNLDGIPDECQADCDGNGVPDFCDIAAGRLRDEDGNGIPDRCQSWFRRGDANGDGRFDISDPISILGCLFLGDACPSCRDAADANDDGLFDITDAVYILYWRFLDGTRPAAPHPDCGPDPTADDVDCERFAPCS
jgi:hypothetical protein